MAGSVNKAIIIGNLGADPKMANSGRGDPIVSFSVATSKSWKDEGGNRKDRTTWHRVVIFQKDLAQFAHNHLKKGMKAFVEGEIQNREWEDQGQKKSISEIVVSGFGGRVEALESIGGRIDDAPPPDGLDSYGRESSGSRKEDAPVDRTADEDIPF